MPYGDSRVSPASIWNLPVPAEFQADLAVYSIGAAHFLMATAVYYFIISLSLAIGLLPFLLGLAAVHLWLSDLSQQQRWLWIYGPVLAHRTHAGIALESSFSTWPSFVRGPATHDDCTCLVAIGCFQTFRNSYLAARIYAPSCTTAGKSPVSSKLDPMDLYDVRSELSEDEVMVKDTVARYVDDRVIPVNAGSI